MRQPRSSFWSGRSRSIRPTRFWPICFAKRGKHPSRHRTDFRLTGLVPIIAPAEFAGRIDYGPLKCLCTPTRLKVVSDGGDEVGWSNASQRSLLKASKHGQSTCRCRSLLECLPSMSSVYLTRRFPKRGAGALRLDRVRAGATSPSHHSEFGPRRSTQRGQPLRPADRAGIDGRHWGDFCRMRWPVLRCSESSALTAPWHRSRGCCRRPLAPTRVPRD